MKLHANAAPSLNKRRLLCERVGVEQRTLGEAVNDREQDRARPGRFGPPAPLPHGTDRSLVAIADNGPLTKQGTPHLIRLDISGPLTPGGKWVMAV